MLLRHLAWKPSRRLSSAFVKQAVHKPYNNRDSTSERNTSSLRVRVNAECLHILLRLRKSPRAMPIRLESSEPTRPSAARVAPRYPRSDLDPFVGPFEFLMVSEHRTCSSWNLSWCSWSPYKELFYMLGRCSNQERIVCVDDVRQCSVFVGRPRRR